MPHKTTNQKWAGFNSASEWRLLCRWHGVTWRIRENWDRLNNSHSPKTKHNTAAWMRGFRDSKSLDSLTWSQFQAHQLIMWHFSRHLTNLSMQIFQGWPHYLDKNHWLDLEHQKTNMQLPASRPPSLSLEPVLSLYGCIICCSLQQPLSAEAATAKGLKFHVV